MTKEKTGIGHQLNLFQNISTSAYAGFWWGKPEGKRPLERLWRKWQDNIKMNLQEVGCGGMDWIELALDRNRWWALMNAVINFPVSIKCGEFLG
jgi:hypothetical protein